MRARPLAALAAASMLLAACGDDDNGTAPARSQPKTVGAPPAKTTKRAPDGGAKRAKKARKKAHPKTATPTGPSSQELARREEKLRRSLENMGTGKVHKASRQRRLPVNPGGNVPPIAGSEATR